MRNEVVNHVTVDIPVHANTLSRFELIKGDMLLVSGENHLASTEKRRRVALVGHLILDLLLSSSVIVHSNGAIASPYGMKTTLLVANHNTRLIKRDKSTAEDRGIVQVEG